MIINYPILLSLTPLIITIIGWGILHSLTKRRDLANRKKEIRIKYLIDAWRLLESASNRKNGELYKNIEVAISDIQLFGSKKQIELAQKIALNISETGQSDTLDLLIELRADLRKELNLESVENTFKFIRFYIS